jgi:hypothetical protein
MVNYQPIPQPITETIKLSTQHRSGYFRAYGPVDSLDSATLLAGCW